MKRLCVFCGSGTGARPEYLEAAESMGDALLERGIGLVYGGANVGTMGRIASTVLHGGGEVIGVIPASLVKKEVAYEELQDLRIVDTMHERKALMNDLSDGFISLPGGLGTFEELFEALAWGQLGIHSKPSGVLNVQGFYNKMLSFIDHAAEEQFMQKAHRDMILVHDSAEGLLEMFKAYVPPSVDKADWIKAQHNK